MNTSARAVFLLTLASVRSEDRFFFSPLKPQAVVDCRSSASSRAWPARRPTAERACVNAINSGVCGLHTTMQQRSKNGKPTKSISEDPPPSIIDPLKAVILLALRNQPAQGGLPLGWFCD
ncbi:hypothetical protein T12_2206 [Trichinella patagoniensis]|uniref:Uncharacterized protein n=1 Tax=Trichinella patagoniensis TaxID=990121 RepID=A0A0V1AF58_9BILA|nr:hypothetical protein T12_2206 [Trichinella patagoniensis]